MIDDQLGGRQRVDPLCIAAETHDGVAHRCQIDDAGNASEVLQDDTRGGKGDLVRRGRRGVPVEQRIDIGTGDIHAILEAQQVLQKDLQGIGQACHFVVRQCRQAADLV